MSDKPATAQRGRIAEFIHTCTDDELIDFVRFSAQFGSMELVRKLMLVWVAPLQQRRVDQEAKP